MQFLTSCHPATMSMALGFEHSSNPSASVQLWYKKSAVRYGPLSTL